MRWLFPFQMNSLFFFFNDQCLKYHLLFYLFIYFFGHVCRMWNFLGQGSNPWHSSDLSRCSDNVRSLTHCATRELQNTICSYMQFTAYSFQECKYYILWDMFLKMNVIDMLQDFFFFFFWLCFQPVEIPGPGIEPVPWQLPEPLQWQHWILNQLRHTGMPVLDFKRIFLLYFACISSCHLA